MTEQCILTVHPKLEVGDIGTTFAPSSRQTKKKYGFILMEKGASPPLMPDCRGPLTGEFKLPVQQVLNRFECFASDKILNAYMARFLRVAALGRWRSYPG